LIYIYIYIERERDLGRYMRGDLSGELAHTITEAEKLHNKSSTRQRTRQLSSMAQANTEDLRTRETNGEGVS
jgi:hypothetical protein